VRFLISIVLLCYSLSDTNPLISPSCNLQKQNLK
jgi:hypothetical protein